MTGRGGHRLLLGSPGFEA